MSAASRPLFAIVRIYFVIQIYSPFEVDYAIINSCSE